MAGLFRAPTIARIADQGQVDCPVRRAPVDVERCVGCGFLAGVVPDECGGVAEIVCRPSIRELAFLDTA